MAKESHDHAHIDRIYAILLTRLPSLTLHTDKKN
jgi:hypothetical protein